MSESHRRNKRLSVHTASSKKKLNNDKIEFQREDSPKFSVASDASSDNISSAIKRSDASHDNNSASKRSNKKKHRHSDREDDYEEESNERRRYKKKSDSNDQARLLDRNDYPANASINTTSPTIESVLNPDEIDFEAMLSRIARLEIDMEFVKKELAKSTSDGKKLWKASVFVLNKTQSSHIGTFVRNQMFKAIKFLDDVTMRAQGQEIYKRALNAAGGLEGKENDQEVYNSMISKLKHYLNVRKGHVIHDFCHAALGE
jgi:hypothetical protein